MRSGCFRAGAEKDAANPPRLAWTGMNICFRDAVSGGAANPPLVAVGRRLFAMSNLLQFCRRFVGIIFYTCLFSLFQMAIAHR